MCSSSLPSSRAQLVPVLLLVAACSGAPAPIDGAGHVSATAVVVTDDGLRPGGEVQVPMRSVIVFRNASTAPVSVHVDQPYASCWYCDTCCGFHAEGAGSSSQPLPPDGMVSICFHEAGAFAFEIRGAGGSRRGRITVGGAR